MPLTAATLNGSAKVGTLKTKPSVASADRMDSQLLSCQEVLYAEVVCSIETAIMCGMVEAKGQET